MKITSHIPHRSIGGLAALCIATLLGSIAATRADEYQTRVVASGLHRPTGIAIRGNNTIYFTEVPTPGVGGGLNAVKQLELRWNQITTLHQGEPEPTNIALDRDGAIYWTCKSAGVILEQEEDGEATVFLSGLNKPTGIAVDRDDNVYFTEVPTPGVGGAAGGTNSVKVSDGTNTEVLNAGDPEPADIAVAKNGDIYWTCKSAGVIVEQSAKDGTTRVLARGLNKPVGITIDKEGKTLYFTEVPTPGVSGRNGGSNKVWEFDLKKGKKTLVNAGDPEPTDIAVARNGKLYWTCTSAGVIVEASPVRGKK